MSIVVNLIFGALVGWIASMIMGSNHRQGLIMDIILGIIGAAVGGWVMTLFGQAGVTGFNLYSLLVGILGAVILIYVGRMVTGGAKKV